MGFDRPAALSTSGLEVRSGGDVIDAECFALLKKMYILPDPTVFNRDLVACATPGWRSGIGQIETSQQFSTDHTANIITGLNRLDMGLNGNFRVRTITERAGSDSFNILVGCWADTHLGDVDCSVLSFKADDMRIQTGTEDFRDNKPGGPTSEDVRGRSITKRVNFSWPFKNTPSVVAFIRGFDMGKDRNLRVQVEVSFIDKNGFTLNFGTWGGKYLSNRVTDDQLTKLQIPCHTTFKPAG